MSLPAAGCRCLCGDPWCVRRACAVAIQASKIQMLMLQSATHHSMGLKYVVVFWLTHTHCASACTRDAVAEKQGGTKTLLKVAPAAACACTRVARGVATVRDDLMVAVVRGVLMC